MNFATFFTDHVHWLLLMDVLMVVRLYNLKPKKKKKKIELKIK